MTKESDIPLPNMTTHFHINRHRSIQLFNHKNIVLFSRSNMNIYIIFLCLGTAKMELKRGAPADIIPTVWRELKNLLWFNGLYKQRILLLCSLMSAEAAFHNNLDIWKYFFRQKKMIIIIRDRHRDIKEHSNNKVIINFGEPKFTITSYCGYYQWWTNIFSVTNDTIFYVDVFCSLLIGGCKINNQ